MNAAKTIVAILCLGGVSLAGCERSSREKPMSAEAEACKVRISSFCSSVGLDDVKILRDGRHIVKQVLSLTNDHERIVLFREFVNEFYKIDISKCTLREANCLLGRYCQMPEYLAYGLIKAGGSREEAWQSLMTGLEKYRQMCFSFGDENDMSDGKGRETLERRRIARWGRKSWKGCLRFCRDTTIKSVFGADKGTVERFQARLESRFGRIEEGSSEA